MRPCTALSKLIAGSRNTRLSQKASAHPPGFSPRISPLANRLRCVELRRTRIFPPPLISPRRPKAIPSTHHRHRTSDLAPCARSNRVATASAHTPDSASSFAATADSAPPVAPLRCHNAVPTWSAASSHSTSGIDPRCDGSIKRPRLRSPMAHRGPRALSSRAARSSNPSSHDTFRRRPPETASLTPPPHTTALDRPSRSQRRRGAVFRARPLAASLAYLAACCSGRKTLLSRPRPPRHPESAGRAAPAPGSGQTVADPSCAW